MTFFKNDKGVAGVLIEKLDIQTQVEPFKKNGLYNHLQGSGNREQREKMFKKIDTTGPIDKDGNPIGTKTEHLDPSDLYKLLENAHSDDAEYIEQN